MGFYPVAPAERIAWDRDGSLAVTIDDGGVVELLGAGIRQALNSETGSGSLALAPATSNRRVRTVAVVFPVLTDLSAFFLSQPNNGDSSGAHSWNVQTSKNTTNGLDGQWKNVAGPFNPFHDVSPNYRRSEFIRSVSSVETTKGIRGVRFVGTATSNWIGTILNALHLYGFPSSTATQERLSFWHPTLDAKTPVGWFDWGDVPRGTSEDRQFRIKNLSSTLSAEAVEVYVEALSPGSPSVAGMHSFSLDGGATFRTREVLPTLAPGAVSPVFTLRRVVPTNAPISVWSARVVADVYSWNGV